MVQCYSTGVEVDEHLQGWWLWTDKNWIYPTGWYLQKLDCLVIGDS